jgi:hypothetical protein
MLRITPFIFLKTLMAEQLSVIVYYSFIFVMPEYPILIQSRNLLLEYSFKQKYSYCPVSMTMCISTETFYSRKHTNRAEICCKG